MKVDTFEKAILAKHLKPLQVIFRKGQKVTWFICEEGDDYEVKPFALIVYDKLGQAWVLPTYHKPIHEENIFNIQHVESDGSIRVNGNILEREPRYDLFKDDNTRNEG